MSIKNITELESSSEQCPANTKREVFRLGINQLWIGVASNNNFPYGPDATSSMPNCFNFYDALFKDFYTLKKISWLDSLLARDL